MCVCVGGASRSQSISIEPSHTDPPFKPLDQTGGSPSIAATDDVSDKADPKWSVARHPFPHLAASARGGSERIEVSGLAPSQSPFI